MGVTENPETFRVFIRGRIHIDADTNRYGRDNLTDYID